MLEKVAVFFLFLVIGTVVHNFFKGNLSLGELYIIPLLATIALLVAR